MQRGRVAPDDAQAYALQRQLDEAHRRAQALQAHLSTLPPTSNQMQLPPLHGAPQPPPSQQMMPPPTPPYGYQQPPPGHQPYPQCSRGYGAPPAGPPQQPACQQAAYGAPYSAPQAPSPAPPAAKLQLDAGPTLRARAKDAAKQWLMMLISTALYLTIGAAVYTQLEGWTAMQSVYFCMVTMSTVGYGDLSPSTDGTKLFTVCWIFFGVAFVFSQVGATIGKLLFTPVTDWGRRMLDKCFPKHFIDIDGDGTADFSYPRHWTIFYSKGMTPSLLLNIGLQMVSAVIFQEIEGWGYGDAVYHCFVTATTVGYGDVYIATWQGQLWACFHILFSVVLLAEAVSSIGILKEERDVALKRLEQLQRKLDSNMLDQLLVRAAQLRAAETETDVVATDLTEHEFVLAMLLQLGVASFSQMRPFMHKFRQLDADGSGRLGKDDLQAMLDEGKAVSDDKKDAKAAPGGTPMPHPNYPSQYVPQPQPASAYPGGVPSQPSSYLGYQQHPQQPAYQMPAAAAMGYNYNHNYGQPYG